MIKTHSRIYTCYERKKIYWIDIGQFMKATGYRLYHSNPLWNHHAVVGVF